MKYRKKPVVIEAILNDEGLSWSKPPEWFLPALDGGELWSVDGKVFIKTLEGTMTADQGDWIIRGVKGELYPCKPDIFEATYEAVE